MKALYLEMYKCRRRRMPLIVLAMMCLVCLWMLWALRDLSVAELGQGYRNMLYQLPLLNAIVLPVLICVVVSRLCDMEHKGAGWKQLRTMEEAGQLYTAKLACAALHIAAAVGIELGFMLVYGKYRGFSDLPGAGTFLLYFTGQFLTSLFLILVIQGVAVRYVNQFVPLVAGLIAGFLGLMSMFFSPWVMRLVPSAYYGLLSTVRMDWNRLARTVHYYDVGFSWPDCLALLAACIAAYCIGRKGFENSEI